MVFETNKQATLSVHAGQEPDQIAGSRMVPPFQTTPCIYKNTERAANLFSLKELGNVYMRLMNPTIDVCEKKMAALERGTGARTKETQGRWKRLSTGSNNA